MLVHHSAQNYCEAASAAAASARAKFDAKFARGRQNLVNLMGTLAADEPRDALVSTRGLAFDVREDGNLVLGFDGLPAPVKLHENALLQMAERTDGIVTPKTVGSMLEHGPWGRELLKHTLAETFGHVDRERVLVRMVERPDHGAIVPAEARAFLSDRYRRWNTAGILGVLLATINEFGALPVDCHYNGLRFWVKVFLPIVFEPVPNEVMIFGMAFSNSDFGQGALDVRFVSERLWCTNQAIGERLLRQVHLGKQIDAQDFASEHTRRLDVELMQSRIMDVTRYALGPDRVHAEVERIKIAHEAKLTGEQAEGIVKSMFTRGAITKSEGQAVKDAYNTPDVEMMPAGNSYWRLAQAFGLVAHQQTDPLRRTTLEEHAGNVLALAAPAPEFKAVEIAG